MHAVSLEVPHRAESAELTFAAVAEDHLDDVYGYLLYLTKNWALAEDLTSETFETALRRWRRFDPRRGHTAPGCSLSRARPRSTRSAPTHVASVGRSAPKRACRTHRSTRSARRFSPELEEGLRSLTAGEREVVALRVVLDLDGDETARLLGITVTAVSTRLHQGTRKAGREDETR